MPVVRQLSQLYLRGSIATVTMTGLTEEQRQKVDEVVKMVDNHPSMASHRAQFIKELGVTIGGDYNDDRNTAYQQYLIAIWRGAVRLLYHSDLDFECTSCNSRTWATKRQKVKPLDRKQIPCPCCQKVKVVDGGGTDIAAGAVVHFDAYKGSLSLLPDGAKIPRIESTIIAIPTKKKHTNAEEILNDPDQLRKFFGEFVWNYFRQEIAENSRETHRCLPKRVTGRADEVVTEEIISLCTKMGVDCYYCSRTQPENGRFTINLVGLETPPEFTAELVPILNKAQQSQVEYVITGKTIEVLVNHDAPTIEAYVVKPEFVSVLANSSGSDDEEGAIGHSVEQISSRSVLGVTMDSEDHVEVVDARDSLTMVREGLPVGPCLDIFDILTQQGEIAERYGEKYPEPKINHIATFLGLTTRSVKNYQEIIKMRCLMANLIPSP